MHNDGCPLVAIPDEELPSQLPSMRIRGYTTHKDRRGLYHALQQHSLPEAFLLCKTGCGAKKGFQEEEANLTRSGGFSILKDRSSIRTPQAERSTERPLKCYMPSPNTHKHFYSESTVDADNRFEKRVGKR